MTVSSDLIVFITVFQEHFTKTLSRKTDSVELHDFLFKLSQVVPFLGGYHRGELNTSIGTERGLVGQSKLGVVSKGSHGNQEKQKNMYNVFELCLGFRDCTFPEMLNARIACNINFI